MRLARFLRQNNIKISPKARRLCLRGMKRMKRSINIAHDVRHVHSMLDNLHKFLKDKSFDAGHVDFEILLPAICWHDAWKAQRKVTNKVVGNFIDIFWDGMGSMLLFKKQAKKMCIESQKIKKIMYAIRKHASIQMLPRKTLEAKILWDLDELDAYSRERFNIVKNKFFKLQQINEKNLTLFNFLMKHWWEKISRKSFHISWFKKHYNKMKQPFLKRLRAVRKQYVKLLKKQEEHD